MSFQRITRHPAGAGSGPRDRPETRRSRGSALLASMCGVFAIAGIILAATGQMHAVSEMSALEFHGTGQARGVAEAGLTDAYAWFRRQPTQPVLEFVPRRDHQVSPPINETDDPYVGLVREYELTSGIWGRYTVRRGTPGEAYQDGNENGHWDPDEEFVDANGDGHWNQGTGTRDVTSERGLPGAGAVWYIESLGEVFRRTRLDLPLGEGPNVRLGSARLATEIRRLTVVPPSEAAICARNADEVVVRGTARIRALIQEVQGQMVGSGVAVASSEGQARAEEGGEIDAQIESTTAPDYADEMTDVFGVEWAELKAMATTSTSGYDYLPSPLPSFGLVVIDGHTVFTEDRPLVGTGLVVIRGNAHIASGSGSLFSGVLYVEGDLVVNAPAILRGTVVVTGAVTVEGQSDFARVEHDPQVVCRLLRVMGQYRRVKSVYTPSARLPDGRPVASVHAGGIAQHDQQPPPEE